MKVKTVLSAAILVRPLELTLLLRAMILFGIIFAFEVGILTTANRFQTHRSCTGAFSSAFSSGFDRYRCELTIRYVGTPLEITIPALN
jgi:hypothetical protein